MADDGIRASGDEFVIFLEGKLEGEKVSKFTEGPDADGGSRNDEKGSQQKGAGETFGAR